MQEFILKVSPEDEGKRLDLFIIDFCKAKSLGLSRTFLQQLISDGLVITCEHRVLKPHQAVRVGEEFILRIPDKNSTVIQKEDIPLEVVYEDAYLAIINKQIGLVVHPAPGNYEHTLVSALLHRFTHLSDINPERPGIVHRLDKETSGLLVVAKNNAAHLGLAKQFAEHSIARRYIALVRGVVSFDEDVVELPITRHPRKRKQMSVGFDAKSKYAKTLYRTLKRGKDCTLLELKPFTGRTHQLRVHLAFLGHPILGDSKYGTNNEFIRLALHAQYLGFTHPITGEFLEFSSPIPEEFTNFLKQRNMA